MTTQAQKVFLIDSCHGTPGILSLRKWERSHSWRNMFFVLPLAWDKEKREKRVPMRNRTSDLLFRVLMLYNWAAETTVSEVYYEVHMRRVLHTARISNVDSVMFVNRIRDMVSFKTYHLCNSIYESFILYFKSTHFFFFLFFLSFLVEAKEPKFAGTLYVIVNGIAIIILHFAKPIMQQKIVRGLAIFAIVW